VAGRKKETIEKENKAPHKARAAEPKTKKKKSEEKILEKKAVQLHPGKKVESHAGAEKKEACAHEEHELTERKVTERAATEHKVIEYKTSESVSSVHKTAEHKSIEHKASESALSVHKTAEHKSIEHKAGELAHSAHKTIEHKTGELAHSVHKTIEHKPSEHKPSQPKAHAMPPASQQPLPQKKPKEIIQPEINIGMIGHVDHGKCIALDSPILLNSELSNGAVLLESAIENGRQIRLSESETIFEGMPIKAFSLSKTFELNSVPAKLFAQNYFGPMVEIETKRGKRITISPRHPLLVNNGKELTWTEGKNLKIGECIATLASIPDQEFVKDFASDWKEKLSKLCWIATREDYSRLKEKTKNFSFFEQSSFEDLNLLRIFAGKSFGQLEKEMGVSPGELPRAFAVKRLASKKKSILLGLFAKTKFKEPIEAILNYRQKSQSFCSINFQDFFSGDILKFIAFVVAEGNLKNAAVCFSQEKNGLLEEMNAICEKLFSEKPAFYGKFDYQINNRALVCFLETRYGIKQGNSRQSGIPEWVFSLPKQKLAVFLKMFFSLEGNFNSKSWQISLCQANKKSISVISYSLKKFGIKHSVHEIVKSPTNTAKRIKRIYWQILISGTDNLCAFNTQIGAALPKKSQVLEKMAQKLKQGKESDEMIPLDFHLFSELAEKIGWKKKKFSMPGRKLREQPFFFAYNDCIHKNAISRKNLDLVIRMGNERISCLELLNPEKKGFKHYMSELSISQQELAQKIGASQKIVYRMLCKANEDEKQILLRHLTLLGKEKLAAAQEIISKIIENSPNNIEWDKIRKIKQIDYDGQIIDLQVPGYHNFVAGIGGILSHNTSLTKALTGKWCDTHSEEMKRGISIRLGYADITFYKLKTDSGIHYNNKPEYGGKPAEILSKRVVSFVDAPGHETLMTTMLSGAALMNGAVLVIAANEPCPQPRTIEHLMALKFAGVDKVVVAQNKVDLIEKEKAIENYKAIRAFLDSYGYKDAPIIPTAANFGANIDSLIEAIETHMPTPNFDAAKPLKMFVARSFDINKPGAKIKDLKGAIIGGSISQGIVKAGDEIELSPGLAGKTKTKVLSIATDQGLIQQAKPGGLIAIGTDLDPSMAQNDRLRGQIAAATGTTPVPVKELTVKLTMFERMIEQNVKDLGKGAPFAGRNEADDSSRKVLIKVTEPLVITIGTNTIVGFVTKCDGKVMSANLKNEVIAEKNEKVAISKNINGQWRLIAYGEVL
jgi:translation initiation factor 2 subunit 3